MATRVKHPRNDLEAMPEVELKAFMVAPIDRDYFEGWASWLRAVFDFTASEERIDALFDALKTAKFTNAELGLAGDWIVGHNERFPVPAHFLNCPALARHSDHPF